MGSKSWLVITLLIIFSIGAGFGGYYLGKYLDTKALEAKSNIDSKDLIVWKEYKSTALKLSFTYPPDWTVSEKTEKDSKNRDVTKITAKSPNNSEYIVKSVNGLAADKYTFTCDKAKPEGDKLNIQACIFITDGDYSFGRFTPLDGLKDDETIWDVAENIDGKYEWNNFVNAQFIVKDTKDTSVLDSIMISLTRE